MANKLKKRYQLSNGENCPGVTTIVGELGWSKNSLVQWANRLGLNGIDSRKYVDDKASIGSLAHLLILSELKKEEPDLKDYTGNQITQAKNCLKSYHSWAKGKEIDPIYIEERFVSDKLRFGGTPDFFGNIDKVATLIDYKSGKGIYPEYVLQVAAYFNLIEERGNKVSEVRILNIPRADDESFAEKVITREELENGWKIFQHLLAIYNLKGAIKKEY